MSFVFCIYITAKVNSFYWQSNIRFIFNFNDSPFFFEFPIVSLYQGIPYSRDSKSFFDKLNGKKYRPEYRQNQDTMLWYDGMMAGTLHANIRDVVLKFRMTDTMFKKRRNGWSFAKKQFSDRLKINKGLKYGFFADVYGFAMFCLLVSPAWVKKIAYRLLR